MPEDDKISPEEVNFWNDVDNGTEISVNLEPLNENANTETLLHCLRGTEEKIPREEK